MRLKFILTSCQLHSQSSYLTFNCIPLVGYLVLQNVEVTALLLTPVHMRFKLSMSMRDLMKLTRMSCVSPTNKFISSDHVFTDSFGAFRGE